MKIKVSVILTVKNEQKNIEKLISSLLSQTYPPSEIIVVDGGSTDGTWEYLKKLKKKISKLKCYRKPGFNIAMGRNFAIKKAKNNLIASIDGGCYADRKWLENLVKKWVETKSDIVAGVFKPWIKKSWDKIEGLLQCPNIKKLKDGWEPSARSMLFTKEIWKKVNGFPENLLTAEDTIFNKSLKKVCAKYSLAKNAIVYWEMRGSLFKIFQQYYRYGKGDFQSKIWKYDKKKIFLIFLFFTLHFPLLVFFDTLWRVRRLNPSYLFFGFFINLSKRYGYCLGFFLNLLKVKK